MFLVCCPFDMRQMGEPRIYQIIRKGMTVSVYRFQLFDTALISSSESCKYNQDFCIILSLFPTNAYISIQETFHRPVARIAGFFYTKRGRKDVNDSLSARTE